MPQPLAEQLRPARLNQLVGQEHLTKPGGLLPVLIAGAQTSGFFPSLILWGPPGCGKTTLARLLATELGRDIHEYSAVNTSVKTLQQLFQSRTETPPLLFIDEIHRFSKSQQDVLLPHVENGSVTLIGATTENPSFSVISALLSRCRVVTLKPLGEEYLTEIMNKALSAVNRTVSPEGASFLVHSVEGDARVLISVIEIASHLTDTVLTVEVLETALQKRQLSFDKGGEEFYNTISAFHKSIRGSDPDAALYWLARMLEAGQDPLYVARRLIRIASEDIGLAQPHALSLGNAAYQACATVGMPECNLALAQATVYMAKAPKSNELYRAYAAAAADVSTHGALPVPLQIRNAPTKLMKSEGYGKNYSYSHSKTGQTDANNQYLPDALLGTTYLD